MRISKASKLALALASGMLPGCTPEAHRYIRFPTLFGPGPAGYQRAEAVIHDPYPLNDVGPEIVGGRPLGYLQPLNEVERARIGAPPPYAQPVAVPLGPRVPVPASPQVAPAPYSAAPYPAAPVQPQPSFQQRSPY